MNVKYFYWSPEHINVFRTTIQERTKKILKTQFPRNVIEDIYNYTISYNGEIELHHTPYDICSKYINYAKDELFSELTYGCYIYTSSYQEHVNGLQMEDELSKSCPHISDREYNSILLNWEILKQMLSSSSFCTMRDLFYKDLLRICPEVAQLGIPPMDEGNYISN